MFTCHFCGSEEAHQVLVDETFRINGKLVLVEKVPAEVCSRCGEVIFCAEMAEKVRILVQGQTEPTRAIKVDVFVYQ
ncbi:hypothetical protein CFPU101_25740 [Chroococcus sp. FPU101]|nr:hypothetical protein CFPU101_25740 [Chroococcus sp. FPU101]